MYVTDISVSSLGVQVTTVAMYPDYVKKPRRWIYSTDREWPRMRQVAKRIIEQTRHDVFASPDLEFVSVQQRLNGLGQIERQFSWRYTQIPAIITAGDSA